MSITTGAADGSSEIHIDLRDTGAGEVVERDVVSPAQGVEIDVFDTRGIHGDRADVTDWLNDHGWTASGVASQAEMRRLDRWVLTEYGDDDAFSTFVVGERR